MAEEAGAAGATKLDRWRQLTVLACAIALSLSPLSHAFGTGTTIAARATETQAALTPIGQTFFV